MARLRLLAIVVVAAGLLTIPGVSQSPNSKPRVAPKLVPVAETKLLMEGIAHPNFQGVGKILKADQVDNEGWAFARGQAILIAETGNLLMLRPPNNNGQDSWMKGAMDLRESATDLARIVATKDRRQSRVALTSVANVCNKCHQSFRVGTTITAFEEAEEKKP
jgi:hypothetical protein